MNSLSHRIYNTQGYVLTHKDNNATSSTSDDILLTYVYAANGLDVTQITRKIGTGTAITLATYEYHPTNRDLTAVTDRAGLRTEYGRNALGQLNSITTPKGDVQSIDYDASGWPEALKFLPTGATTPITIVSMVFDDIGRLSSESDVRGYAKIHEYDDLNRRTKTTYPDLTFVLNEYGCCMLTSTTERDGLKTRYNYDAIKRLISTKSPGGKLTDYGYDKVGNLTSLRTGRGEVVSWEYDTGNRQTARINQDGTRLVYAYNTTNGRIISSKDAQNRQTTYNYNTNGWLQSVTHPNLPTQSFTYNTLGQRLTWTDGTQVTTYGYDTQDRLTSVDGPLANDTVTYGFDAWGRSNQWTYDGASETYTFDSLGRIATVTNPLGTFTRTYDGNSNTLTGLAYPVAGLNTTLSYLPLNQDARLSQILHEGPGNVEIAKFGYTYHTDGSIATWEQTQPGLTGRKWEIQQDLNKQLSSIVELPLSGSPPSPQRTWRHQYDPSGNRTLYQEPGSTSTATYNSRNQLTSQASGGATWFRGQVNEAAQVTVGGQSATVQADGTFDAVLPLGPGVHDVAVAATDKAANTTSETWRVDNGSSTPRAFTYDADGNTLSDGLRTYGWDASNRLSTVSIGSDTWTFQYGGTNLRRSEQRNGSLLKQWIWKGFNLVEERIAVGGKRRFWMYGVEELDASNQQIARYYTAFDHLGSVRLVLNTSGNVVSSLNFSAWGDRQLMSGSMILDIGFTSHWHHESGLLLAPFRAYSADWGRWLSEDPIGEAGGLNLYGYVDNGPANYWDSLGLKIVPIDDNAKKALETLRNLNDPIMNTVLKSLDESKNLHRIESRFRNDFYTQKTGMVGVTAADCMNNNDSNGVGAGTLIGIPIEDITYRGEKGVDLLTPASVLAHELVHSYDIDKGIIQRNPIKEGDLPPSEQRAYQLEDRIRPQLRLPPIKNR